VLTAYWLVIKKKKKKKLIYTLYNIKKKIFNIYNKFYIKIILMDDLLAELEEEIRSAKIEMKSLKKEVKL
jgi:hypothetical protein